MEFDQHAFEEYISSGSETPAAGRPPKMAGIESRVHAQLCPTKVGKDMAVGQGAKATFPPSHEFSQVVGDPLPSVKHNCNAKRCQRRCERHQLAAAVVPSSPSNLNCVWLAK